MKVKLRPHQLDAVQELKNGSVLWGGMGSGKTLTAIAYYMLREAPKDIIVITTARKRDDLDWEREAAKFAIGKEAGATIAGILTVDSWNNIKKYEQRKDAFFIFDEQRLVGKGAWVQSFLKIAKTNHWILLSATPGDNWLDYLPVFLANGFYKNRTEFLREHVVYSSWSKFPKVERYINEGRLNRHRRQILVHMPYKSHVKTHERLMMVPYDQEKYDVVWKKRWNPWKERPIKNISEFMYTLRKVVNSDEARFFKVRELMKKHPKLIVFYNYNYELEMLRELAEEGDGPCPTCVQIQTPVNTDFIETSMEQDSTRSPYSKSALAVSQLSMTSSSRTSTMSTTQSTTCGCTFRVAEWNGHKHEPIPDTDRWVYLVQYASGAEGWNCVETNAMVFWSLTHSYKMFKQAHGRIDRLDTPYTELYYYVFLSNSRVDISIHRSLRQKKSFNEAEFLKDVEL